MFDLFPTLFFHAQHVIPKIQTQNIKIKHNRMPCILNLFIEFPYISHSSTFNMQYFYLEVCQ